MPVSDGKCYVRTRILPPSPYFCDTSSQSGQAEEDSDVEEVYPYVISHGRDFKLIDPKVYKQLRKHNIHQKTPVRIADCAKKVAQANHQKPVHSNKSTRQNLSGTEGEYCELSPLAKQPSPTKLYSQSVLAQNRISRFNRLPSYEKRLNYDCYKPKKCIVQSNPGSTSTKPKTKILNADFTAKTECWGKESSERKETVKCFGVDADEAIDCVTCMCCAKGLFYHCTKDGEDEGRCAENPCSCAGPLSQCAPRWGCLAVLSLFFPCILCYPPAVGCRKLAAKTKTNSGKRRK